MTAVPFNKQNDATDVAVFGDTAHIDLWYPRVDGRIQFIHVGLVDVRAADGIRIHYDFDRDGFVVEQPQPRLVRNGPESYEDVEDWIEVGFFQSWQFNNRENCMPSQTEYEAADMNAKQI